MNFVKLTLSNGIPIFINLNLILHVERANGGSVVTGVGSSQAVFIQESPEQIMSWIATGKLE